MTEKKEMLLSYIKANVAPILIDFLEGKDLDQGTIIESDIDINEFSKETYIIAISKLQPLEIRVFEVTDEPLNEGLDEIANLFDEIKWHQDNDKWDHSRRYYEGHLTEKL